MLIRDVLANQNVGGGRGEIKKKSTFMGTFEDRFIIVSLKK